MVGERFEFPFEPTKLSQMSFEVWWFNENFGQKFDHFQKIQPILEVKINQNGYCVNILVKLIVTYSLDANVVNLLNLKLSFITHFKPKQKFRIWNFSNYDGITQLSFTHLQFFNYFTGIFRGVVRVSQRYEMKSLLVNN